MAGDNDLTRMQDWIRDENLRRGHERPPEPPVSDDGWAAPAETPAEEPGPQKPNDNNADSLPPTGERSSVDQALDVGPSIADTGPPRFRIIDLDAKLAAFANGAVIPISDEEAKTIAGICMQALDRHMIGVFKEVGTAHGIQVNLPPAPAPAPQIPIPFPEKKRGKR